MAGSVNRVILVGRVGKDPTKHTFPDGNFVVNFSMATSKSWKDRGSGERKEVTAWHNVQVQNNRLAEVAEKYIQKGSSVYVEGEISYRKYTTRDGQERYITEIVVGPFGSALHVLSGAQEQWQQREPERTDPKGNPQYAGQGSDLDDSIPF
jgi:single-strand DNA-binding protein